MPAITREVGLKQEYCVTGMVLACRFNATKVGYIAVLAMDEGGQQLDTVVDIHNL